VPRHVGGIVPAEPSDRTLAPIVRSRVPAPLQTAQHGVPVAYLLSFTRSLVAICCALRMRNLWRASRS
jgi:hypothetical protein